MAVKVSRQSLDLQRFSENAAKLLLEKAKVEDFLRSIGSEPSPVVTGDLGDSKLCGYKVVCPVCKKSGCFVGVDGNIHKIYWRCYCKTCRSREMKPKNLLSLVRWSSDNGSLAGAIKTISSFLGFRRSYDITNGDFQARAVFQGGDDDSSIPF
jgi:hypothetical protein